MSRGPAANPPLPGTAATPASRRQPNSMAMADPQKGTAPRVGPGSSALPPHGKQSQGAADARKRPASYTPVCEQAADKADGVPGNCLPKKIVLLTGMSGAGKTTAVKALEDGGYYCIDNLPSFLLPGLLHDARERPELALLALGMDARDQGFVSNSAGIISQLKASDHQLTIIFLEADDQVLLRRYSEMRRRHPFATPSVRAGIQSERQLLSGIRAQADLVIDTSRLTPHGLRSEMLRDAHGVPHVLQVGLVSFGFKHGVPQEADVLFDVRFLPNPFFVPEFKPLTGQNPAVAAFVLESDLAREFLDHLLPLLTFLIPQYQREGKSYLTIGIGCTGGQHRSVAVAERLGQLLKAQTETVFISHRDLA